MASVTLWYGVGRCSVKRDPRACFFFFFCVCVCVCVLKYSCENHLDRVCPKAPLPPSYPLSQLLCYVAMYVLSLVLTGKSS